MKPRVLIVDDEPEVLDLVDFKLSNAGFEVLRAACGLEALRLARSESPHIIVLDLLLPDLNGLCVCEILCAQPSTRDVPIIILSALDRSGFGSVGARIRVSHWLKKGSDLHSLCGCVRSAFDEHLKRVESRLASEKSDDDASADRPV